MEQVFTSGKMENPTMVNIQMTRKKALVSIFYKTAGYMKAGGLMESNTGQELLHSKTVNQI